LNSDAAAASSWVFTLLLLIGPDMAARITTPSPSTHSPADAIAVAAVLGYERFGVLGFRPGKHRGRCTAAFYPDRVSALGIVGGGAPFSEVPDELAKLSDDERRALDLVDRDEAEAERLLAEVDRAFLEVLSKGDEAVVALWRSISPPADVSLFADADFAALVVATHRESLRQGQQGWARDNVVRMTRWNVDLSRLTAPAWFWYGEQDAVANGSLAEETGSPRGARRPTC
jgi:pimeloyl-ACP methyl ester carboxylesterase